MGYNKFRWYTNGFGRKKPLSQTSPLLLKIKNGDFDYSPYFLEAEQAREEAKKKFDAVVLERSKFSNDKSAIEADARDASRMRRVAAMKLDEKGAEEEQKRLYDLRKELELEFGKDLWDECMEKQRGKGTIEDIYWWYKKKVKMGLTPSEVAIQLGRKTIKGLR